MIGPLAEPDQLRWLYIDFNSYFASVEQQVNPALRGKPVAVLPVESESTCAIAASYEARAFGIRTGMPVYEARRRCPQLVTVLADHARYVDFHRRIIAEVNHHIPVSEVCSIDEVACRLMANEADAEIATAIARRIKQGLAANIGDSVRCSIGIAPNTYLAKVATDLHKPDGLTVLHPAQLRVRLLELAPDDLPGIGPNIARRLRRQGICRMEELLACDRRRMRALWGGIGGERMWYQLRGYDLPPRETTRGSVGHSHVLAPALRPPHQARLVARRLTAKAASRLRRMGYYAAHMRLSVRTEEGSRHRAEAPCFRAQDSLTFLHMLDTLWNAVMCEAGATRRLKKVSVTLSALVAVECAPPELFATLPDGERVARARAEQLSRALDAINGRFGRDAVVLGVAPRQARGFSGAKVAFTRIPDTEEFHE